MDETAVAPVSEMVSAFREMPAAARPSSTIHPRPDETDLAGWHQYLIDTGVKPDRVASPDLLRQLAHAKHAKIDTVVCCALDTDPSVPLNAYIAASYPKELAAGVDLLAKLTAAPSVWITADPEKPADWYPFLQRRLSHPGLRKVPLRGDYPQTDPSLLLHTILERSLKPGQLPTEKSVLLIDAAAAVAVGQCVLNEAAPQTTPLAVRDHFQRKTHLLIVPINTPLGAVCEFLDIGHPDPIFRAGDFLRDAWIAADALLGNRELVIHITARHLDANPDPCIRCGWCVEMCPTQIHPAGLLDAAQHGDPRAAQRYGIDACIECGICSYVCPTRLPLLVAIRGLKVSRLANED